jgi:hypothetical protein
MLIFLRGVYMDLDKITRLQSLLDLPDKLSDQEEMSRPALELEETSSENQSIFDYLDL